MNKNHVMQLIWFLKRPKFYPELIRRFYIYVFRIFFRSKKRSKSSSWCSSIEVSQIKAFNIITNNHKFVSLQNKYPDIIDLAKNKELSAPIKMGGPGAVDFLYSISEFTQALNILETGVAYGWSSLSFLLSLKNRTNSHLYSIDMPYPGLKNDDYVGCIIPKKLRHLWTLYRQPDRLAIPKVLKLNSGGFDIIHYDSDKTYEGRKWAYPKLWKGLKKGGILISDDIDDNFAFKEFSNNLLIKPIVFNIWGGSKVKYIGVIQKPF